MEEPLRGVIVYADVRSRDGKANYSASTRDQLTALGAEVRLTLTADCTHAVFKDGKISTLSLAAKFGVKLVSVLWVESCREHGEWRDEKDFFVNDDKIDTPVSIKKSRYQYYNFRSFQSRLKSLQPDPDTPKAFRKRAKKHGCSPILQEKISEKPQTDFMKRLQWPPDHSDVCDESELAVHEEITVEMSSTKSKKRLMRSSQTFLDSLSQSDTESLKMKSTTDNFILRNVDRSLGEADLSSYNTSVNFAKEEFSVSTLIGKLKQAVPPKKQDLLSKKQRKKCDLTDSQTNRMNEMFEIEEDKENSSPPPVKRRSKKNKSPVSPKPRNKISPLQPRRRSSRSKQAVSYLQESIVSSSTEDNTCASMEISEVQNVSSAPLHNQEISMEECSVLEQTAMPSSELTDNDTTYRRARLG
eukprot:sb/3465143/